MENATTQPTSRAGRPPPGAPPDRNSPRSRVYVIAAALLALFLGALDTLVMGAAMPTIVADLGGLHLYAWVFSAYLLSRTVILPVIGKLCDLFDAKVLFNVSIAVFLAGSLLAGCSQSMTQLILSRVLQGLGAGGIFGLCYYVLSAISTPEKRGKMMSLASFVWGLASVFGPSFGGFVVTYFSWRWIFFVNVPLGLLSFVGISLYLNLARERRTEITIDYAGITTLTIFILALLTAFLLAGRDYPWMSLPIAGLLVLAAVAATLFYQVEKRAREPILSLAFFRERGFSTGNGAVFCTAFAIFALASFSPLFIQGALGKSPAQLGLAMVSLSLAWSMGALLYGQLAQRVRQRPATIFGAALLAAACGWMVTFSPQTSLAACFWALGLAGLGMGIVSIATLLAVQNSLANTDLGVATSSHQFTRTLGGTIGIGIAGSLMTTRFVAAMEALTDGGLVQALPDVISGPIHRNMEALFHPQVQSQLPEAVRTALQNAVGHGVTAVFWTAFAASAIGLIFAVMLPGGRRRA